MSKKIGKYTCKYCGKKLQKRKYNSLMEFALFGENEKIRLGSLISIEVCTCIRKYLGKEKIT